MGLLSRSDDPSIDNATCAHTKPTISASRASRRGTQ
jgi:hypothetical protein